MNLRKRNIQYNIEPNNLKKQKIEEEEDKEEEDKEDDNDDDNEEEDKEDDNDDDNEEDENDEEDEEDENEDEKDDEDDEEDADDNDDNEEDENDEEDEIINKKSEIYKKFINIKNEINKTEPNLINLLNNDFILEDKIKLFHLYNIYKNCQKNTEEWFNLRNRYNNFFKEYKNNYNNYNKYITFSKEEHSKMINEKEKITYVNNQIDLKYKILSLETSIENKKIIFNKYQELINLENINEEYSKLNNWLKWAISIPYNKIKINKIDNITEFIKQASIKLDEHLFGMKKIKEQILLFLSSKILNPNMKKSNLGLIGPPGVGKTEIAKIISSLLDIGFEQISFGGINNSSFLKGHDYTYIGSEPGEIVKCLKKMGHNNGIIFLDELDKASDNTEISASLLHLIDPTQNYDFRDNYLSEISIDLSNIWFISSMNKLPKDKALIDRWFIIEIDGYDLDDKIIIIEKYLLPKTLKNINMNINSVVFEKNTTSYFIKKICNNDFGCRTIQKALSDLINKIYFILIHQNENGNLPFKTSFCLEKKLILPIILTNDLLNCFLEKENNIKEYKNNMYI